MGFGGNQNIFVVPTLQQTPKLGDNEQIVTLLSNPKDVKEYLQNCLLQCQCTQEDIECMLEYAYRELIALDFESILSKKQPYSLLSDPIVEIRFLAKERQKTEQVHKERLEKVKVFLAGYTQRALFAAAHSQEVRQMCQEFAEKSPTGKRLTVSQCEDMALYYYLQKRLGDIDLEKELHFHSQEQPAPQTFIEIEPTPKQGCKETALALAKHDKDNTEKDSDKYIMLEVGILSLQGKGLITIAKKFEHSTGNWTIPRRNDFIQHMKEAHNLDVKNLMPQTKKKNS